MVLLLCFSLLCVALIVIIIMFVSFYFALSPTIGPLVPTATGAFRIEESYYRQTFHRSEKSPGVCLKTMDGLTINENACSWSVMGLAEEHAGAGLAAKA